MCRFRVKQRNLSTDVQWLKEGATYDGDFVPMKDRMVLLRSSDGAQSVELPLAWLDDVTDGEPLQELTRLRARNLGPPGKGAAVAISQVAKQRSSRPRLRVATSPVIDVNG